MAFTQALVAVLALLAGTLPHKHSDNSAPKKANGDKCVHHTQCSSDCCLIDLERSGAFCTSKSRVGMGCLPQYIVGACCTPDENLLNFSETKRSLNIMCPCRAGLSCHSKDHTCPRRCQMI